MADVVLILVDPTRANPSVVLDLFFHHTNHLRNETSSVGRSQLPITFCSYGRGVWVKRVGGGGIPQG